MVEWVCKIERQDGGSNTDAGSRVVGVVRAVNKGEE